MKNPLPNGSYRIRTFNGSYLLTMPSNAQPQTHQDQNIYVSKRQSEAEAAKFQRVSHTSRVNTNIYITYRSVGGGTHRGFWLVYNQEFGNGPLLGASRCPLAARRLLGRSN